MKVILSHRLYGSHADITETEIAGAFYDYATPKVDGRHDEYRIDEDKLLAALPAGFLPEPSERVLLTVATDSYGTGQIDLKRFRDWAKYFPAYVLNLIKDGAES